MLIHANEIFSFSGPIVVFTVLSTSPNVVTSIYGALGSDTFVVAPRSVDPVISKNLKGHTGVLEHAITSNDTGYDGLLVEGVAVNVLDNDGLGYLQVVETSASYVLTEDDDDGRSFEFYIFPTVRPTLPVIVEVGSQISINDEPYAILTDLTDGDISFRGVLSLRWDEGEMKPKHISVKHNHAAAPLSITDYNGLISIDLASTTEDPVYLAANQTIQPLYNKLIPRKDGSSNAKSVTVIEPSGETVVVEGANGFDATYNIYLRPCTNESRADTVISIVDSVPNQVAVTPKIVGNGDWDDECKATISVSAIDDKVQEGLHFVTLMHDVTSGGAVVVLSDNTTLVSPNVLVKIYDDDIAGVIIEESNGATSTAEIDSTDTGLVDTSTFSIYFEDSYKVRLSQVPNSTVTIDINGVETASDDKDQLGGLVSNAEIALRVTPRIQAQVRVNPSDDPADTISLTFTTENWFEWQTVYVSAVDDDITEGVDLLNFPSQPSYLSLIQGPLNISGSDSPTIPSISDPLMLPGETDVADFEVPSDYTVDVSAFDAIEDDQVNHLIIYNLDVRGTMPSVGVLTADQFSGMNMGQNLIISGVSQLDGIVYQNMNLLELYLGEGIDEITVESTSEAVHYLHANLGNDKVHIEAIAGPFIVNAGEGDDTLTISSTSSKLDEIMALVAFDGGPGDYSSDVLVVNNSGALSGEDPVLNLTRQVVEVDSMTMPASSNAPRNCYLFSLRGAVNGTYDLVVTESLNETTSSQTVSVSVGTSADELEGILQAILFPEEFKSSCGLSGTTACSQSVKVYDQGEGFLVTFIGERLNKGVSLNLITDNLDGFESEIFQGWANDILERQADIAYANVNQLDIFMGAGETVVNARGTSATTTITTQDSDDYVFISSEANQDASNAASVDFLRGWLDYFHGDLALKVGSGRHRLMLSDESSNITMGSPSTPAILSENSLTETKPGLGDIFFSADTGGHWSAGVNFWLGQSDDYLSVESVPSNEADSGLRTATSVHAGPGDDVISVTLDAE